MPLVYLLNWQVKALCLSKTPLERLVKFAVGVHGTRGDIEPCAAVSRELLRRGHDVRLAVPPNLLRFVETAGLPPAAPYGVDSQQQMDADIFRKYWKIQNPVTALREHDMSGQRQRFDGVFDRELSAQVDGVAAGGRQLVDFYGDVGVFL
ncbi:glycosyltransferase, partial [Mycolicibacterium holsaticum]|uniref:glycosyltransferase n=1 Tax=Mycolicibacterium holsaticum TaxID=152142 RepID=UPI003B8A81DC